MPKVITEEELGNITTDELRDYFTCESYREIKHKKLRKYICDGKKTFSVGKRVVIADELILGIILERFLADKL